ncbi:unnamed protein product [Paramecium pentaurelia]|uniref:Uncharacterized protein n=1 Tax=Paramecium pentaurelia TaxID=43138 RepID=A0A8S1YF05_9CILI|nr:unnamed protein product [Paramecium pentaurelia]
MRRKSIVNQFMNECGNGLLVNKYDECDDGNIFGGDGFSSFFNMKNSYHYITEEESLRL